MNDEEDKFHRQAVVVYLFPIQNVHFMFLHNIEMIEILSILKNFQTHKNSRIFLCGERRTGRNQRIASFSHFDCDFRFCSRLFRVGCWKKNSCTPAGCRTFWHRLNILIAIRLTAGSEWLKRINRLDDGKFCAENKTRTIQSVHFIHHI